MPIVNFAPHVMTPCFMMKGMFQLFIRKKKTAQLRQISFIAQNKFTQLIMAHGLKALLTKLLGKRIKYHSQPMTGRPRNQHYNKSHQQKISDGSSLTGLSGRCVVATSCNKDGVRADD